jgi:hypothetical protein
VGLTGTAADSVRAEELELREYIFFFFVTCRSSLQPVDLVYNLMNCNNLIDPAVMNYSLPTQTHRGGAQRKLLLTTWTSAFIHQIDKDLAELDNMYESLFIT